MIIDLDSHLREIYFMDKVYKLEGRQILGLGADNQTTFRINADGSEQGNRGVFQRRDVARFFLL